MAPIRRKRKEAAAQTGDATFPVQVVSLMQGTNIISLENNEPSLSGRSGNEQDHLVLCAASSSGALENKSSLHPILESVQHEAVSASRESEAMRKWKEMKQNGFLSNPHGGMPSQPQEPPKKKRGRHPSLPLQVTEAMPKANSQLGTSMPPSYSKESFYRSHQHGGIPLPPPQCSKGSIHVSHIPSLMVMPPPSLEGKGILIHEPKQSKRKEAPDPKKNKEQTRERAGNFKSAPPSGLLSGLNTGVIRRVRNHKEVHAFLNAILQPELTDVKKENGRSEENNSTAPILPGYEQRGKKIASETAAVTNHRFTSNIDSRQQGDSFCKLERKAQESFLSLTKKGAAFALEWLEFLHKDIRGRLSTLQHSKQRVTEAISKRMPDLVSSELSSKESGPMLMQSPGAHCFSLWTTLFRKFHARLCEEEKMLETKSSEIQEMLLRCDLSLRYINRDKLPEEFGSSEQFSYTKANDMAAEYELQAAAAAIYSICSFVPNIRRDEARNFPCFLPKNMSS